MNCFKKAILKHNDLIKNSIWRTIQLFFKHGVLMVSFFVSAKVLSPYVFGVYNYVIAIILFVILFCDFGISTATARFVAQYNKKDKSLIRRIPFNASIMMISCSVVAMLVLLVFGRSYFKENFYCIFALTPVVFLAPLTSLYDGLYRGLKKFKPLALISIYTGLLSLIISVFVIFIYGLWGAIFSQTLFYTISFVGLFLNYKEYYIQFDINIIKNIGKYSLLLGGAVIGYYLFSRIDILVLGHYSFINQIATYELLNKIYIVCLFPVQVVAQVVFPNFAEYSTNNEFEKIYKKVLKYMLICFITSLLFLLLSLILIPIIVKLLFPIYDNIILSKLLLPVTIIYALQIYNTVIHVGIISATGHVKIMTYLNIVLAMISIISNFIFINKFGYLVVIYINLFLSLVGTLVLQLLYLRLIRLSWIQNQKFQ